MENSKSVQTGRKHTDPVWKTNVVYEDGEWWWYSPSTGSRARVTMLNRKNAKRMYVAGNYIPQTHPLWKSGKYESWEHAHNHIQLNAVKEGYVYLITNPAWTGWVKCGKAVDAEDRLRSYNTSAPHRDYKIGFSVFSKNRHAAESRAHRLLKKAARAAKNEWFKIAIRDAKNLLQSVR
jgi:hypothetical protein